MGGFLLIRKNASTMVDNIEAKYRSALRVFEQKRLSQDARLVDEQFVLYVFRKKVTHIPTVLTFENGDFVVSVGTNLYRGLVGLSALQALFNDFISDKNVSEGLYGAYAVLIHRDGRLFLLTDYAGYYPVYCNDDKSVISSSFLAIAKSLPSKRISAHELYEYIFHGFFAGHNTLLSNIRILDSRRIWQLIPKVESTLQKLEVEPLPPLLPFDQTVELILSDLLAYFTIIGNAFGKSIGSALSGGYDTRLMLAIMRKAGIQPILHVYGSPSSSDVTVAKAIADAEGGVHLEHIDKDRQPIVDKKDFPSLMERQFYFFDGLKSLGVFDNGSDLDTRLDRAKKAVLQLNGAGGEIYREIWNVPDKSLHIKQFLQLRYDFADYSFCRGKFDKEAYFDQFADKVKSILEIDQDVITRKQMEMLFPFLRNKLAASNNSVNNQISPAVLPFMEPRFIFPSFEIPIKWKFYGRFNAALCRLADPSLASYISGYGHNFQDSPSLRRRFKTFAEMHVPFRFRLLKRARENKVVRERPYYLREDYLRTIFRGGNMKIQEFIDIDSMNDSERLSRALSVELLVSDIF